MRVPLEATVERAGQAPAGGAVVAVTAREVEAIPVLHIRPEDGLGRKRDRVGHQELCRSIEIFGVLTPITVRRCPDMKDEYLLVKGQGRTLACRMLGIDTIPAIVVDDHFREVDKVQQFLVENVARLRMGSIDRALLISRARSDGEETTSVARRFGVSAATVRRLEDQLDNATSHEVAALRAGTINLAVHNVVSRHVPVGERPGIVDVLLMHKMSSKDLDALFRALGWRNLVALGPAYRTRRLLLFGWACHAFAETSPGSPRSRLQEVAAMFPDRFDTTSRLSMAAAK